MAAAEAEVYSADVFCFAGHGVPFGIIFGGTDLNEDVNDGEKHQAMGRVLQEARYYDPRASQALDARPFWMQVHGNRDGGGQACGGLTPYHRSPLPPLRSFCFYFAWQIFVLPQIVLVTELLQSNDSPTAVNITWTFLGCSTR